MPSRCPGMCQSAADVAGHTKQKREKELIDVCLGIYVSGITGFKKKKIMLYNVRRGMDPLTS